MTISIFKNDFANSFAESWLKSKFRFVEEGNRIFIDFGVQYTPIWDTEENLSSLIWGLVFLREGDEFDEFEDKWHRITTCISFMCPWM